eukprot:Skav225229  [mRNA]  locus=scaffold2946:81812:88461:+ [translate_table: standard]
MTSLQNAPDLATDLNGVQLPKTCFLDDSKGLHHVFVIGDWGGVIDWYDRSKGFVHPPKTADHTKLLGSERRKSLCDGEPKGVRPLPTKTVPNVAAIHY